MPSFVLDLDAVSLLFSRPMQDLHIWWTSRQAQTLQNKARLGPERVSGPTNPVIPIAWDASPKQVDALRWELQQKEKQSKRMSGSAFVTFKEKWGISGWLWQWRLVKIQCLQDVAHLLRLWLSLVLEDYSKCEPVKAVVSSRSQDRKFKEILLEDFPSCWKSLGRNQTGKAATNSCETWHVF